MTTNSPELASPVRRAFTFVALHGQNVLLAAILGFVLLCGYAGAFQHMRDWTMESVPRSHEWQGWANAIISELMPAAAFLIILKRQDLGRSITAPRLLLIMASGLSLCAQLSATGFRFQGDTQLLACLPLLAVMVLGEMILSDWSQGRKIAEQRAATAAKIAHDAELAAEQARRDAELAAELAAEHARRDAELAAEHAAELERKSAEHAAEVAERQRAAEAAERLRLAELEQAAITRREQLAADERRAEREARMAIERQAAQIEAQGRADAERLRAEADAAARQVEAQAAADLAAAETVRRETETKIREQAVSRITGRHRPVGEGSGTGAPPARVADLDASRRSRRRSRDETLLLVEMVLAAMPAGTDRASAVKAVAAQLESTERYARDFVPDDWSAASSDGAAA